MQVDKITVYLYPNIPASWEIGGPGWTVSFPDAHLIKHPHPSGCDGIWEDEDGQLIFRYGGPYHPGPQISLVLGGPYLAYVREVLEILGEKADSCLLCPSNLPPAPPGFQLDMVETWADDLS